MSFNGHICWRRKGEIGNAHICGGRWQENKFKAVCDVKTTKTFADIQVWTNLAQNSNDESFGIDNVLFYKKSSQIQIQGNGCGYNNLNSVFEFSKTENNGEVPNNALNVQCASGKACVTPIDQGKCKFIFRNAKFLVVV